MSILKKRITFFQALMINFIVFCCGGFLILLYKDLKEYLPIIADFATIIALSGVSYAVFDYYARRNEAKQLALNTLRTSLEVIGTWSSYNTGGYRASEKVKVMEENRMDWSDPFFSVNPIDPSALQSLWVNPGFLALPKSVTAKLAAFIQEVTNFNTLVETINQFRYHIASDNAANIQRKLRGIDHDALNYDQRSFVSKLLQLNIGLHFINIGDETTNRLYAKHKVLYEAILAASDI